MGLILGLLAAGLWAGNAAAPAWARGLHPVSALEAGQPATPPEAWPYGVAAATPISPTESVGPMDSGGGEYLPGDVPDLTEAQRQAIQSEIDKNIRALGLQGISAAATALTVLPVQGAPGQTDYGYHGISGFVDHNPAYPNQLQDWNCGTRTYDTSSGYNHKGTDFFTWPFGWYSMDNNRVQAVAAAPGTIIYKSDGNYDRNCAMGSGAWNAVYILHADGSVAWYGHLKNGSLTSKEVGASMAAGEYLGVVGSSGSSTGPHLHFELHTAGGSVVDPYAGSCNPISAWWAAQRPYYDSAINKLATGHAAPVFPSCPAQEIPNTQDHFEPGDTVYFVTYYRDQVAGQISTFTIYQPGGAVYRTWTAASSGTYSASYWYWSYTLSSGAPQGQWKFQVVYNGQTYAHNFTVGATVSLWGRPADRALVLNWQVAGALPAASTWRVSYIPTGGTPPSPVTGIISPTRTLSLTNLTNYTWYTVTLNLMDAGLPVLTNTVTLFPTDKIVFLPKVAK